MPAGSLSPMMQQYREAREAAGDALLLFRMGDFYELFFDDAKTAARTLGLALTSRDKGDDPVPMAGFPTISSIRTWPKSSPPATVPPSANRSRTPSKPKGS